MGNGKGWRMFVVAALFFAMAFMFPMETASANSQDVQAETVAACLILEAGGEPAGGMEAVFGVIKNRAKSDDIAKWHEVVLKPKQFCCFNSGTSKAIVKAKEHPHWQKALSIVKNNDGTDYARGATHYHVYRGRSKVTPYWTSPSLGGRNKKAIEVANIGNHVFLKNVD